MAMTDAMVRTLLIAQLRRFRLLALARLRGVASCRPGGNSVEKAAWRGHLILPVERPEEIEARQCVKWVLIIGEVLGRGSCEQIYTQCGCLGRMTVSPHNGA